MVSFVNGMVDNSTFNHISLKFAKGTGNWPEYDRVTSIFDKKGYRLLWRIESRLFNCCGTSGFENLAGRAQSDEMMQEIICAICEHMPYYPSPNADGMPRWGGSKNWYSSFGNWPDALFIPTVEDKAHYLRYPRDRYILAELFQLGAGELITIENEVHDSSGLVICSWNPKHCVDALKEKYLYFTDETHFIPLYLKEEYENHVRQLQDQASARATLSAKASPAVAKQADQTVERRPPGAPPVGDVGFVHRADVQQPNPNQNNQNWVNFNPNRNPFKQGI